jgi:fibronectin-binding autotransporter adhesin
MKARVIRPRLAGLSTCLKSRRAPAFRRAVVVGTIGALGMPAVAAVDTYTFPATNSQTVTWSSGTNWSAGAPAIGDPTQELTFSSNSTTFASGYTSTSNNDETGVDVNILDLNGTGAATTAAAITISGNALTFISNGATAPVINLNALKGSVGLTYTVSTPLSISNNLTFQGNGTATFNFTGAITGNGNSITKIGTSAVSLTNTIALGAGTIAANAGTLTLGGIVSGTGGTITVGGGTITLSANNTFTSGVTLNTGLLNFNNTAPTASASPIGTGVLTINGGTIDQTANAQVTLATNNAQTWDGNFTFTGTHTFNIGTGAVTLTANRIVTNNGFSFTEGGAIGDGGSGFSLTKSGNGLMILSGANTYSGGTTVTAGTLQFNSLAAIAGSGANVTVNSGAAAAAGYAIDQTFLSRIVNTSAGVIALGANSANALDFSSAGANLTAASLGADGNFTYSGTLTPNGTTYRLGGGSTADNAGSLTVSSALNDAAAGPTSLVVSLNGTTLGGVILTNSNGYTGSTTINAGASLQLGAGSTTGSIPSTSGIVDNGILAVNRSNAVAEGTDFPGGITGSGGLSELGTGTLTILGTDTYTGNTVIDQGTIASSANLTFTGGLVFGATSGSTNHGALTLTGANGTFGSLTVQNNNATANTITLDGSKSLTINGPVSVGVVLNNAAASLLSNLTVASGSFTANLGTGTLAIGEHTVTGTPTGTGVTGTLDLSNTSAVSIVGLTSASAIVIGLSQLTAAANTVADTAIGTLKLSTAGTNTITVGTITLGTSNSSGVNVIQGFLTLGNAANNINANTVYVGRQKSQIIGTTPDLLKFAGTGGTLTLKGFAGGTSTSILDIGYNDVGSTGTITQGEADFSNGTFNGTLGVMTVGFSNPTSASAGGGKGTFIMAAGTTTATQVVLGATNAGTVANTVGTFTLNGGSFTLASAGSGINQVGSSGFTTFGVANLTVAGTGDLELANSPITLNGTSSTFTFSGGALGNVTTFSVAGSTNLTDSGGTLQRTEAGTTTVGTLAFSGTTSSPEALVTAGTLSVSGTGITSSNANSSVHVEGGTLNLNSQALAAGSLYFRSGTISNMAAAGATLNSTANPLLILQDTNVNFPVALIGGPTSSAAGDIHFENATGGPSGGTVSGSVNLGAVTRVINVDDSAAAPIDLTVSGIISNGAINKLGAGALAFTNANTHTGGTSINAGILLANNPSGSAAGNGPVNVNVGTLGGNGTITGLNSVVNVTGNITAGATPTTTGLLTTTGGATGGGATTSSQTWNSGGNYNWKFSGSAAPNAAVTNTNGTGTTDPGGSGTNWDMLSMNTLSVASNSGSPFTITPVALNSAPGTSNAYTIADITSGIVTIGGGSPTTYNASNGTYGDPNTAATALATALQGLVAVAPAYSSSYSLGVIPDGGAGDDIVITYTGAPEPSSIALLAFGFGGIALRRRRRVTAR